MMQRPPNQMALIGTIARFFRDRRAASAVEFSIVAAPFFYLLMGITQVGIFYMAQSALDTGVSNTALTLRANFSTGTTATLLGAASLRSGVASGSGAMIANDSTLSVDLRQLTNLSTGTIPIVDSTVDYGSTTSTLVLRAQSSVVTLAPGRGGLNTVYSSALVRRQGT